MIDTAQFYGNEQCVGSAVKKCGLKRSELFVTSKVWISNAGERHAYREGLVRAIGVSNLVPGRFIDLQAHMDIKPMVNQVETHILQGANGAKP